MVQPGFSLDRSAHPTLPHQACRASSFLDLEEAQEAQSTETSVALVPPVPCAAEVGRQELFPRQPRRAPMYREGARGTRARTPDAGAPPAIETPTILDVDQALRLEPQHPGTRNACPKAPGPEALAWWIRQSRGSSRSRVSPFNRPDYAALRCGGTSWRHPRSEVPANMRRRTARNGRYPL
jgi:hypothetical protein